MKKSILSLKGAQELTKNQQKEVNGGKPEKCIGGLPFQDELACVCTTGGYYPGTQECIYGNTGNVWNTSTNCCYNFTNGDV